MPLISVIAGAPLSVGTFGPVTLSGTRKVDQLVIALALTFPPINGCVFAWEVDWRLDAQSPWQTVHSYRFTGVWPLPLTTISGAVPTPTYGVSFGGNVPNIAGSQVQARVTEMTGVWTGSMSVNH